jgi:hypothetical protein
MAYDPRQKLQESIAKNKQQRKDAEIKRQETLKKKKGQ